MLHFDLVSIRFLRVKSNLKKTAIHQSEPPSRSIRYAMGSGRRQLRECIKFSEPLIMLASEFAAYRHYLKPRLFLGSHADAPGLVPIINPSVLDSDFHITVLCTQYCAVRPAWIFRPSLIATLQGFRPTFRRLRPAMLGIQPSLPSHRQANGAAAILA